MLGTIDFQAPDEGTGTDALLVAAGIEAVSEGDFSSSSNATSLVFKTGSSEAATEKGRLDSSGRLNVGQTSAYAPTGGGVSMATFEEGSDSRTNLVVSNQNSGSSAGSAIALAVHGADYIIEAQGSGKGGALTFTKSSDERMRIDSSGNALVGRTSTSFGTTGVLLYANGQAAFENNGSDSIIFVNRVGGDGDLIRFYSANGHEGSISVSGSTVTYGGFSGLHESSGIATDTPVGTVVSTIDELDLYPTGTPKAGQTRADHAKVKVSDTAGDKAVYGVVSRFDADDKVYVASVGIGSVRVTGACAKGDLLESNGDGTAKVQSDDIVRSKTIGKVTIGNSSTDIKLVSCVLYCG